MKYKIAELINLAKAQVLTDSFCEAVGIASAIIDLDGKVLIGSRWQKICTDFHRVNPQTRFRCIESDTVLANKLLKGQKYAIYECRNGLTDTAAPIVIEGEHIANFFVGQFLLEPPDIKYFKEMAREYGFDETSYLEALSKVPIIPKERIEPILDFLSGFAEFIGEIGLMQIRQLEATDALQEGEERLSQIVEGSPVPIFVIDKKHTVTYWNKACESLTGVSASKVVGTKKQWSAFYSTERPVMADFITDESEEEEISRYYKGKYQKSVLIQDAYEAEDFFPNMDRSGKWLFFTAAPLKNSKGNVIGAIETVQDITKRRRAEKRIEHLNSVLKAIRNVNQLIMKEKDKDSLLQKTCEILIEARGYDAAWLGLLKDGKTFAMVKGVGFGDNVNRFSEYVMKGEHPLCIKNALAEKISLVVIDKSKECGDCFFRDACVGKEAVIIRVEYAGRFFGLLTVLFAADVSADDEEKGLLKEVAGDIAFALYSMQMEEVRQKAEEKIEHLNLVLRAIRNVNQLITKEKDRNRLLQGICDRIIETRGYFNTWIVLLDDIGKLMTSAQSGLGDEFLPMIELLKRGKLTKCGQKALKQSDVVAIENPPSECADCPLVESYKGRAGMSIRLAYGGKVYGIMSVSIPANLARDEEEQSLFKEVARDVVFALYGIELEERRKMAEEERKWLNAQVIQKNKELEQIVYTTSHDLRSPLVNIQGFSKELNESIKEVASIIKNNVFPAPMKEKIGSLLEQDIPESLQYILTSVAKMDSLLNGLLKLSRLGRAALKPEKIDMGKLINKVINAFEFKIKESDVKLEIFELPPCKADKTQIDQVFSNLMDNALKYLDSKRQGIIRISGYKENTHCVYCVEDNGIGIAPKHQKNIFTIFHQLDPTRVPGQGLGLTIVRRILDRHGGKVWVKSELGKGSKFYVSLPGG